MEIDHVIVAVTDLAAAGRAIESRYGLETVEGGRHPAWGTANRIVPLGGSYVELISVVDSTVAAASAFGRWVAAANPGRPLGWAVRTDDLDGVAKRLGLTVVAGSREAPGGQVLSWRSAGGDVAAAEPSLPFFIERAAGSPFPGRTATDQPGGWVTLRRLRLSGDRDRLAAWLGEHDLPIVVRAGPPRVEGIEVSQGSREFSVELEP